MKFGKLTNHIIPGISLAVLVAVAYHSYRKPIIEKRALTSNMNIIQNAIEVYHINHGVLPESLDFLVGSTKFVLNNKPIKISEWRYYTYENDNSYGYSLAPLNSKL